MNTITAAAKAGVTVATIRTWCRCGAVAAIKVGGRWDIEPASLAHRIEIGRVKAGMSNPDRYHVTEGTTQYGSAAYTVKRTDGTERDWRVYNATYTTRENAELHCEFVNRTPDEYRIHRDHYRARSITSGYYWEINGGRNEDPRELKHKLEADHQVSGNWPEGTRLVDMLVRWALQHAEGAEERIAKKAEEDAIAAAEAAVREAREAQLAKVRRTKGELATKRQVDYILQLLAARERSGEGGGFFSGPTNRAGIEELSKGEASMYIRSLKGDY